MTKSDPYSSMKSVNETDLAVPLAPAGHGGKGETLRDSRRRLLTLDCIIILGCAFMALLSATPNGFNSISLLVQQDTGISDTELAVFTGLSVGLLQFSLPWGPVRDHFGPVVTAICSAICVLGGYVLMSFTSDKTVYLMILSGCMVGLGSSGTFLSALATSIDLDYPAGVGLVSLTMSLSIAFTSYMAKVFEKVDNCSAPHCWRPMVRFWAIVCAVAFSCGIAALSLLPRRSNILQTFVDIEADGEAIVTQPTDYTPIEETPKGPSSLLESLHILADPLFWAMFTINTASVGAGVFIVTEIRQIWEDFNTDPTRSGWDSEIRTTFSVCTGISNVVAPILTDYCHRKRIFSKYKALFWVLLVIGADMVAFGAILSSSSVNTASTGVAVAGAGMLASIGLCFGTFLVMTPVAVSELFGMENFGIFVSYSQIGSAIFASVIPLIATSVRSKTGSFAGMFFGLGGFLLVCACIKMWVAARLKRKQNEEAPLLS